MGSISIVIADDEPLAREGLALRLRQLAATELLAACADGHQVMAAIQQHQPDVVFLDIDMPGLTGLEVVKSLSRLEGHLPLVVLTTAYAEFALSAFEYEVEDYLLKPFTDCRLQRCMQKIDQSLAARQAVSQSSHLSQLLRCKTGKSLPGLIASLEQADNVSLSQLQQTISLKSGSEWLRLNIDDILWIEAAGDYMCVHTCADTHIIRKTLKQFVQELDHRCFTMVNRSAIVNLAHVVKLSPNSNGEYLLSLVNGKQLKVSRRYKFNFAELKPSL